jgi:hypothetical protein
MQESYISTQELSESANSDSDANPDQNNMRESELAAMHGIYSHYAHHNRCVRQESDSGKEVTNRTSGWKMS